MHCINSAHLSLLFHLNILNINKMQTWHLIWLSLRINIKSYVQKLFNQRFPKP